ncbi:sigma 54 modulation/S30EA ribosomal C-terminal domain-containing protein [Kitasatospora sp. RG8]|uniref:sigma 54 modulation/S30EA ribosomal C-terminal domain-containing protein n=1 Tax=Kitasatospora sp. RG8 TaxID=2820815 RepID=UPI001AE0C098|nr:sigma 54 modulation/S30EA ribosomal C-terminal domain-containing protein [Kitasatospora sp. RG8]MBP0452605.1 sigma 54 modulation/S30EA ribosomal C-terminal domain-containing protein [Kitasatospora sp. RG8]
MGELITVQVCEGMPGGVAADARARIAAVVNGADALVEALRVRVGAVGTGGAAGAAGAATVLAQVNAEVDGRRIRVQESAADLGEALDRLADGLRGRIATAASGWTPRPWSRRTRARGPFAGVPGQVAPRSGRGLVRAGAGLLGADPCTEVPYGARPERIVRRKRAALVWCSPDAAARTMDAMDFDIHLFTDPATETDAVVYRVGPTGYRLARTTAAAPPTRPAVPLTVSPCGAPELTEERAVERLSGADLPFLFFAQPGTRRGRVLYRRHDGGLGLIAATP